MRRPSVISLLLALVAAGCGASTGDSTAPSVALPITSPGATTVAPQAAAPPPAAAPTTSLVIDTTAIATSPASRVAPVPTTPCEQIATRLGASGTATSTTSQLVIVRTTAATDTTAILQVANRSGTGWTCGPEMTARVGRAGVRPLLDRRSGDDTTPAGVFPLGTMTAWDGQAYSFFGNSPDPGVGAGTYRRTRVGDCFGAAPNTPGYGHLRNATNCPGPDDEYLPSVGAYTTAALIGANMEPNVSGDAAGEIPYASAIFLHRFTYATTGATSGSTKATSGCVSLAQVDLTSVLVELRRDVHFAIGTTDYLLAGAGR